MKPIKYELISGRDPVYLELRNKDENLWAICNNWREVYDFKIEKMVDEPSPSNRSDDFIERCRVDFDINNVEHVALIKNVLKKLLRR